MGSNNTNAAPKLKTAKIVESNLVVLLSDLGLMVAFRRATKQYAPNATNKMISP